MKENKYTILFLVFLFFSSLSFAEWKKESEAGVIVTSGNSETSTYHLKDVTDYLDKKNIYRLNENYLKVKQKHELSVLQWRLEGRYEREFDPEWNFYAAQSVEGDRFAGILQRYNTDLGSKYFFQKKEKKTIWFLESGYRFTYENAVGKKKESYQKGRLYSEFEHYLNSSSFVTLWMEYLPNFTQKQNWFYNANASVVVGLFSYFFFKCSYEFHYNNAPVTIETHKTDRILMSSLLIKF